jgi:hypothetical protein
MPTKEEMRSLGEKIVGSYEDRIAGIAELRVAVKTQLKEFDHTHAAMSRELKADLAKVRPALEEEDRKRQSETREFMGELGRAVAQGKAAVKAQLKGFDDAHATMSRELKADLAKVRPALEEEDRKRQSEAREFMGELGRAVAQGKAATQALLRDFGEVQAGARDEWQKLTATMRAKRGAVVAEITPGAAALREQVFEYLANHPDGTKLVELAEEFGIARIQIAKVVRNLMDENKVEKRDLLYFAV